MGKFRMTREEVRGFLGRLGETVDIKGVLKELGVSPGVALRALQSAYARQILEVQRQMAQIHGEIIADQSGPEAVEMLKRIALTETKAEVRLRGVLQLLALAGKRLPEAVVKGDTEVEVNEEWMEVMAEALAEMRRRKAMGETAKTRNQEERK